MHIQKTKEHSQDEWAFKKQMSIQKRMISQRTGKQALNERSLFRNGSLLSPLCPPYGSGSLLSLMEQDNIK